MQYTVRMLPLRVFKCVTRCNTVTLTNRGLSVVCTQVCTSRALRESPPVTFSVSRHTLNPQTVLTHHWSIIADAPLKYVYLWIWNGEGLFENALIRVGGGAGLNEYCTLIPIYVYTYTYDIYVHIYMYIYTYMYVYMYVFINHSTIPIWITRSQNSSKTWSESYWVFHKTQAQSPPTRPQDGAEGLAPQTSFVTVPGVLL